MRKAAVALTLLAMSVTTPAVLAADPAAAPAGIRSDATPPIAEPDTSFLADAIRGGLAEVEAGRVGAARGSSPEVRRFGERMVRDHSAVNEKLKAIAAKHKIEADGTYGTQPLRPEEGAAAEMKKIAAMSGAEFDRAFVGHMVKDHEKDVALFRAQAKDGKDGELKGLAAATLPTLEEHLKMAQAQVGQVKASN